MNCLLALLTIPCTPGALYILRSEALDTQTTSEQGCHFRSCCHGVAGTSESEVRSPQNWLDHTKSPQSRAILDQSTTVSLR